MPWNLRVLFSRSAVNLENMGVCIHKIINKQNKARQPNTYPTNLPNTNMTNWMTQSTIARFHEARHAGAAPFIDHEEPVVAAHPHAVTLSSFATDSTIYRLHEDRHHGIIHATSPSLVPNATDCHWPSFQDFCAKSSIHQFHEQRHAALGISTIYE